MHAKYCEEASAEDRWMNKDEIKLLCKNNLVLNRIISFVYRIAGRSLFIKKNGNNYVKLG